jgi:transposase
MMKLWRSVLVSSLLRGGQHVARKLKRAQILLAADAGVSDETFAHSLGVGGSTVYRTKRHFVEGTLEEALHEEPRPGAKRKLTGQEEALLVATACSRPPEGRARWTIESLAGEMVRLTSRIAYRAKPCREIAASERQRNLAGAHLKWMFTTEKAPHQNGPRLFQTSRCPRPARQRVIITVPKN